MAAAVPPIIRACAAAGFLLAAKAPSNMLAIITGVMRFCCAIMRAICRWVIWLNSCANTDASSSRLPTTATRPVCTPIKPPGSANAFTVASWISITCQAKRSCSSAVKVPRCLAAAINSCQMPLT
ncbi:hypothetical protein D3C71_1349130 [compost metagenome]